MRAGVGEAGSASSEIPTTSTGCSTKFMRAHRELQAENDIGDAVDCGTRRCFPFSSASDQPVLVRSSFTCLA